MASGHGVVEQFRRWQREAVAAARFECTPIRFAETVEWSINDGRLRHRAGGFFSLAGIEAEARDGALDGLQQLIIFQPEIAINGFLLQERESRPHLLFQGRIEPGNVGGLQLAPTVQSTPSNYRRVHGGRPTAFVGFFLDPGAAEMVIDTLQSEEGTRYCGKYNRNVVARLRPGDEGNVPPQYRWYDFDAIRAFAHADNVLNTDARSVLACLDWRLLAGRSDLFEAWGDRAFAAQLRRSYLGSEEDAETPTRDVLAWLADQRARLGLRLQIVPLGALRNWVAEAGAIREREPRLGFAARLFHVVARGREVDAWDQPLIDSQSRGLIALVCQARGATLKFLVKASREIGFLEGVQLGPSVNIPPGGKSSGDDPVERLLLATMAEGSRCQVLQRLVQSEEGGRFYQDENEYSLVVVDGGLALPATDNYRWLTLAQIRELMPVSGTFSIELRGALSLVLGYA